MEVNSVLRGDVGGEVYHAQQLHKVIFFRSALSAMRFYYFFNRMVRGIRSSPA
jgi:hypothetical protein